ncbi:uncharacterized protein LOC106473166 [Limulus polyphemus]|uniref:Uncharacterized protein LOC106473166 n=1 Tax=Limulus polyphemus TaxID=6850 RepID=A0ABM1TNB0_LIMPO|nr:uncharacterized protein LOC106473166 [Limulus polyphemus]
MEARPFIAVLGCFLMYVGLGTLHLFGNITPYLTSYLRKRVDNNTTYEETTWIIYTTEFIMSFIFIGVWLAERIGQKSTIMIGTVVFSFGIAGTYWTIQQSLEATLATLGVVSNLGFICCFGLPIPVAMEWFPKNRGLLAGIVSSGAALTPVLMNNLHTYFMNPNNLQPDANGYFYDSGILDRVPTLFLIMGAAQGGILLIGLLLYKKPPSEIPMFPYPGE